MFELQGEIEVPRSRDAVAFSFITNRVSDSVDGLWLHLMRVFSASLEAFSVSVGSDALCCVELSVGWDRKKRPATILAVYFSTDGLVTREAMAALEPALAGSGLPWSVDGVLRRSRAARPILATNEGALVQIWQDFEGEFVTSSVSFGQSAGWALHHLSTGSEDDFLPGLRHASCRLARRHDSERHALERLKVGFGYAVAHEIIEADGVIEASEIRFVDENFPPAMLCRFGINDENYLEVRAEAEPVLAAELGHHEKLALLSLFYSACYADGRIELSELTALRSAAEAIGLERGEVAAYLQRLW